MGVQLCCYMIRLQSILNKQNLSETYYDSNGVGPIQETWTYAYKKEMDIKYNDVRECFLKNKTM